MNFLFKQFELYWLYENMQKNRVNKSTILLALFKK